MHNNKAKAKVNPFFRTKVPFPSTAFPLPRVTIRSEHPFAPVAGAVALTPWASCFSREDRLPRLGPGLLCLGLFHRITRLWSTPAPSALPPLPGGLHTTHLHLCLPRARAPSREWNPPPSPPNPALHQAGPLEARGSPSSAHPVQRARLFCCPQRRFPACGWHTFHQALRGERMLRLPSTRHSRYCHYHLHFTDEGIETQEAEVFCSCHTPPSARTHTCVRGHHATKPLCGGMCFHLDYQVA